MSRDNCLQRAHQLSADASLLVRPPDADSATLTRGLQAYREAADLFEEAGNAADDGTRGTLRMLTTQHRKLARDVERRISSANIAALGRRASTSNTSPRASPTMESPESPFADAVPTTPSRESTPVPARPALSPRYATSPAVGLAAGRGGPLGGPGLAIHATSTRSVPPFSMRPVAGNDGGKGMSPPRPPFAIPGSPRSPMYSSSSSSEPPDESYLLPGAVPDSDDPFSRFWGMLENMLEEISFPKALTTMPIVEQPVAGPSRPQRLKVSPSTKEQRRQSGKPRSPSPSESFYVVPRDRHTGEQPQAIPARKTSPAGKTPEELALENESLRASLDALAVHAHSLEVANKALTERAAEHDKVVKSVVHGVRREAQRARHDQEVLRSQMLASSVLPAHRIEGQQHHAQQALKKRISELEEETAHLREDNQKLNLQLDKFKEKWEKLKAKKEAKVAAAKAKSPRTNDK